MLIGTYPSTTSSLPTSLRGYSRAGIEIGTITTTGARDTATSTLGSATPSNILPSLTQCLFSSAEIFLRQRRSNLLTAATLCCQQVLLILHLDPDL